jgi:hypothetical protein
MLKKLESGPGAGLLSLALVLSGLALGHSLVVTQWGLTGGISVLDSMVSATLAITGFTLVWIGLKRPETQATMLGYAGGNLIWVGLFEWTWHYFGHWLKLEPIMDGEFEIIAPGLLMIQSTGLLVIGLLIFLGSNKDTRCRMFLWFHRNFRLRPGRMTPGYQRQFSRITAIETIFLIWFIYLCAIVINDPRLIKYDSPAAMAITVGFIVWGLYLANKLMKIRTLAAAFRYAIPTGSILWLPIEAFSRWGLYPQTLPVHDTNAADRRRVSARRVLDLPDRRPADGNERRRIMTKT